MIVLRKTMEAAVEAERRRGLDAVMGLAHKYGATLQQVIALERQMSAWVLNKAENITPDQAADMFYAQDDRWQAAFFNVMQARVLSHHETLPPPGPNEVRFHPGIPYGESQWWHMAQHLTDFGFETLEAMYEHAKSAREKDAA